MKKKRKFRVGDKIIDLGQVFRIFKIEDEENRDGKLERVIYFRPYFNTKEKSAIICSIPVKNIDMAEIRRPISREELEDIVAELKRKRSADELFDITKARELIKTNNLLEIVNVVKALWNNKKNSVVFSRTKSDVFNSAIDMLAEEFALVCGVTLDQAREDIRSALRS